MSLHREVNLELMVCLVLKVKWATLVSKVSQELLVSVVCVVQMEHQDHKVKSKEISHNDLSFENTIVRYNSYFVVVNQVLKVIME